MATNVKKSITESTAPVAPDAPDADAAAAVAYVAAVAGEKIRAAHERMTAAAATAPAPAYRSGTHVHTTDATYAYVFGASESPDTITLSVTFANGGETSRAQIVATRRTSRVFRCVSHPDKPGAIRDGRNKPAPDSSRCNVANVSPIDVYDVTGATVFEYAGGEISGTHEIGNFTSDTISRDALTFGDTVPMAESATVGAACKRTKDVVKFLAAQVEEIVYKQCGIFGAPVSRKESQSATTRAAISAATENVTRLSAALASGKCPPEKVGALQARLREAQETLAILTRTSVRKKDDDDFADLFA